MDEGCKLSAGRRVLRERAGCANPRPQTPIEDEEDYGVPMPVLRETALQSAMRHCAEVYGMHRERFKRDKRERSKAASSERKEQRQVQRRAERREQLRSSVAFSALAQAVDAVEGDGAPGDNSTSSSSSSTTTPKRFAAAAVTTIYTDYVALSATRQARLAEELRESIREQAAANAEYRGKKLKIMLIQYAEETRRTEAYRRQKLELLAGGKENVPPIV